MEFCGCKKDGINFSALKESSFMRFLENLFLGFFFKSHQVSSMFFFPPRKKTFLIIDDIHFPFKKQSDICFDLRFLRAEICFYGNNMDNERRGKNKQPTRETVKDEEKGKEKSFFLKASEFCSIKLIWLSNENGKKS